MYKMGIYEVCIVSVSGPPDKPPMPPAATQVKHTVLL